MKNKNDTANLREHNILNRCECYALTSEPPIAETEEFQGNNEIQEIADIQEIEEIEPEECTEDEEVLFCVHCGETITDGNYRTVGSGGEEQIYCSDCFDDKCFHCPDCGENFLLEESHIVYYGSTICSICAENYYYCDSCGRYIHYDDYNSDRESCYDCLNKNDTGVESYHANDDWDFIGECKPVWKGMWRGIGIELEIDRDDDDRNAERQTAWEIKRIYNNLKFEYDGSLDHGFEIITHPHTVDEFYAIDWAGILDACKNNGYVSHSANHCGLHIHFSRAMFGSTEKKQANAISKLINFFETFWE